ncbi:MAG: PA2778 family cysteine peptidase, partial [Gammaproteobacteria bacterium]|nr:PA2778 family cysteine peptidase [Gammaproteobacteria bacterium]
GCASIPDHVREMPRDGARVELADTPFHPQSRYQCGPAALTTVLQASGASVELDDIVAKVYIPGRQGSLQLELLAATRTSGRLPYRIDGTLSALLAELQAGRPVLLLQNLGVAAIPRWHYAVAVGIDSEHGRIVLRSGQERRRETPIDVFLRTWSRGDFWGLVTLRPGELPANVDRARYFSAVVGLEQTGQPGTAALAWQAAVQRWPGDTTARFGLGNARLAQGEFPAAEARYRELLLMAPDLIVARNNLALALARQQRLTEALRTIDEARQDNDDPSLEPVLAETRDEILAMLREDRD